MPRLASKGRTRTWGTGIDEWGRDFLGAPFFGGLFLRFPFHLQGAGFLKLHTQLIEGSPCVRSGVSDFAHKSVRATRITNCIYSGSSGACRYHVGVPRSKASTIIDIVRQRCPRCRDGRIFKSSIYWSFPGMHDCCPSCGLHFNREPGYFLGAMYVSYGLALAMIAAIGLVLWGVTNWRVDKIAIWAVVLFLPFAPMLTLLSRVLWIYLDQKLDPER